MTCAHFWRCGEQWTSFIGAAYVRGVQQGPHAVHADIAVRSRAARRLRHRVRLCVCRERAVGRRRARVVGRRKNATREPKTT